MRRRAKSKNAREREMKMLKRRMVHRQRTDPDGAFPERTRRNTTTDE